MPTIIWSTLAVLLVGVASAPEPAATPRAAFDAGQVLAKSREAYAALQSYADSGTVVEETSMTAHHTFRTLFIRDPRYLLIDFRYDEWVYKNGNRLPLKTRIVLWMQDGELQTWSGDDQAHETYPADGGGQVQALKTAAYRTKTMSVLIPSHLYGKSGLASVVHATEDAQEDGVETIDGRRCFRILGVERWRYPSGQVTGVRPIALWIDAETYLLRRIVEDTPKGMPRGSIDRRTFTIRPQANPKLDPTLFRFTVPER